MTPERWQKVKEVFHRAALTPPGELQTFLDDACGEDRGLRREVESLLESDDRPLSLLEPAAPGDGSPAAIGSYRLLHRIGAGGMSEVFLAVRGDDEYQQRVALKLIRRGLLSSADGIRRFRQERQILAGLEHPSIARLLDGGTTPEGLPFFVMEYVEGQPLDEYCARRRLSLRRRVELFLPICQAVQHAHRNLVVHRDLKPGNVLVTAAGVPRLLDVGVAKLLNPELSAGQVAATAPGTRALTLGYASPEQVTGEPVTTASDVYSLGVVLYELLTGRRPLRLEGLSPSGAERRIREEDPPPPSQADLPASRGPGARGGGAGGAGVDRDLDAIVLKALRKEPSRRYGSAAELEADLLRFLRHEPVLARAGTWAYRGRKFVRRHRLTAAFLLVLLVFGGVMAVQTARLSRALEEAQRERQAAGREHARAEQVSDFLIELFHLADPRQSRSRSITAVELLDRGTEQAASRLQDQPLVRAALLDTLGRVYRNLGIYEQAEPLLQQGLRLRRQHPGAGAAEVAASLSHLAELRHAQARYGEAEALVREALELQRGRDPRDPAAVAAGLHRLAEILHTGGDYEAAGPVYRESLALRRSFLGPDHPEVAESLSDLGYLLYDLGRFDEAEGVLREALALCRRIHGGPHPVTAYTLSYLADLLAERGDLVQAEPFARQSLEMHRRLLGEEHPDTVTVLASLGSLLLKRGQREPGTALLRRALASQRRSLGGDHPVVGTQLVELATALKDDGDLDGARGLLEEAVAIFEKAFAPEHPARATTLEVLADILRLRGETEGALKAYRTVLELRRASLDPGHPQMAFSLVRLGITHRDSGNPTEGERYLGEAAAILREAYVPGDWRVAYVESERAEALMAMEREELAEPLLRGAIAVLERSEASGSVDRHLQTAHQRLDRLVQGRAKGAP